MEENKYTQFIERLNPIVKVMYNDDTNTAVSVLRSNGAVISKHVKEVIIPICFFFSGMEKAKEEYVTNWVLGCHGEQIEANIQLYNQHPTFYADVERVTQ